MHTNVNLQGSLLVANPSVKGDTKGSVILIFSHSLGIVQGVCINKPHPIHDQLYVMEHIGLPPLSPERLIGKPVYIGGNSQMHHGIVIHDQDPGFYKSSNTINDKLCVTLSNDVLINITQGVDEPTNYLLAIGRYSWSANDLFKLIKYGRYFVLNFDFDIVMRTPYSQIYDRCFEKLGFHPDTISRDNTIDFDDITTLDDDLIKLYWIEHKPKEKTNEQ